MRLFILLSLLLLSCQSTSEKQSQTTPLTRLDSNIAAKVRQRLKPGESYQPVSTTFTKTVFELDWLQYLVDSSIETANAHRAAHQFTEAQKYFDEAKEHQNRMRQITYSKNPNPIRMRYYQHTAKISNQLRSFEVQADTLDVIKFLTPL